MTPGYVLLPEAETDLRAIIRYTRAEWGDAQTRNYVAKLTRCIAATSARSSTYGPDRPLP